MRDHLNKFMDTVDKLTEMDIIINNDLLSIMILYSLPASYENFRIAIESRDLLPSPECLKIKILEESEARNKNYNTEQEEAFLSRRRNNNFQRRYDNNSRYSNNNSKQYQSNITRYPNNTTRYSNNNSENRNTCRVCSKPGHCARDCRSKNYKTKEETFKAEVCLTSSNEKIKNESLFQINMF